MTDFAPVATDPPRPRTKSREARRTQLIESTIETIAKSGFARTTLSEVARTAGLSHGLVNFHFKTKEKLLGETLAYLAEEYWLNWKTALEKAGAGAAAQLNALMKADFNPGVCTPARLSAWCSFWGEAQSRPMYQESCGSKDENYTRKLEEICARLVGEGGYPTNPVHAARVIRVTIEGVWLDLMTMARPYSLAEGMATVRSCAALCFPKHFDPNRPIAR